MTLQLFLSHGFDLSQSITLPTSQVRPILLDSPEYEAWKKEQKQSGTSSSGAGTYKVKAGDTVGAIAKRFNVSSKDIIRLNNLDKAGTIKPGMRLAIRKPPSSKPKKKPTSPNQNKHPHPPSPQNLFLLQNHPTRSDLARPPPPHTPRPDLLPPHLHPLAHPHLLRALRSLSLFLLRRARRRPTRRATPTLPALSRG